MFSMFREDSKDGTTPGPVSMRRVLAFILAIAAIGLFVGGILSKKTEWYVFIPGGACLVGALAFLVLTTVTDVQSIVAAWKGIKAGGTK
jgi:1,4-dihydroxy-2-naphthoate octaprenyltransferase